MKYAVIENSIITNIIVAEPDFISIHYPSAIDITSLNPAPDIGYQVSNGKIIFPPAPPNPIAVKIQNDIRLSVLQKSNMLALLNNLLAGQSIILTLEQDAYFQGTITLAQIATL